MALAAGTRLGPYEVVAAIGAGGMGEVYRGRDTRLGREVAIKVLPDRLAADPDALARFEREARMVAALSHPGILALYDVGREAGVAWAVLELLDGETLRERLRAGGALPSRRAREVAVAVADALAAAHEKGIVHRDLKPENVFLTRDGRVKVLDFGLARPPAAVLASGGDDTSSPTAGRHTEPGMMLGTVGYMSPEQVRGEAADHRADIFSFGCLLFELLTGRRAFQRETAAETLTAILREDLPEASPASLPPALEPLVRHCVEKDPARRFQSARDVAFALATADVSSGSLALRARRPPPARGRILSAAGLLAAAAALFALGMVAGRRTAPRGPVPHYRQLTSGRGTIRGARFAGDNRTVVYSAAWDGGPARVYLGRTEGADATLLPLPPGELLAASATGELALSLGHRWERAWVGAGTLASASLLASAARPVLEGVREADFAPGTSELAIVRRAGGRERLEFPAGKVLYETEGYVSHVRFSRDGRRLAFFDHPVWGDDRGDVALVSRAGGKAVLSAGWSGLKGLAWSPDGREVWISGDRGRDWPSIEAIDPSGRERLVARAPASLVIADAAPDGTVLLVRREERRPLLVRGADGRERDLSWSTITTVRDVSPDGALVLVDESGHATGSEYAATLRPTDGSAAVRLGEGAAQAISPDGRWVASIAYGPPVRLLLLPTGPGESRRLDTRGVVPERASWMQDGTALVVYGRDGDRPSRLFVVPVGPGAPRALGPDGVRPFATLSGPPVSPDGRTFLAESEDGGVAVFPTDGGAPRPVRGLVPGDVPLRFTADGAALFVAGSGLPVRIFRLDLATGARRAWAELTPADPGGLTASASYAPYVRITPDGRTVAWTPVRLLDELFVAEGLR